MPSISAVADLQTLMSRTGCAGPAISQGTIELGSIGIPSGRMTEVFGPRSSGKTSIAFAALAHCTRSGAFGAYVDPGESFFAPAAAGAGVETRRLIVVRPHDAAGARRAVDALVRGGACAVVVFDCSGLPNALQTHHCARLVAQAEKTGTALLVISSGNAQPVASFASLRLRACGLSPLWQEGSDGGSRLLGCAADFEVAKARSVVRHHRVQFDLSLPDVVGTWPTQCEAFA